MTYCTNCGDQLSDGDVFCQNCGEKIEKKAYSIGTTKPQYPPPIYQQPVSYQPQRRYGHVDRSVFPSNTGDCLIPERCAAACIDNIIISGLSICFTFPGCFYSLFKDGIRQGRSFGKSAMNLRVVKYNTGEPADLGDSCVRNLCNCCVCIALIEKDKRHMGDLIAGTVVIRDR